MLIYNAIICTPEGRLSGYVVTENGVISKVSGGSPTLQEQDAHRTCAVDAGGAWLLPGAIDAHVHFREPGLTHKATIASESAAALAGGVTSFMDMPNTVPPTVSVEAWEEKMRLAERSSVANYAFFIGATADNMNQLRRADYSRIPGIKLFMGSSTGRMAVGDERALAEIFETAQVPVVVHAEDDAVIALNRARIEAFAGKDPEVYYHSIIRDSLACVKATEHAMELAQRYGTRLHIAHVSTAEELSLLSPGPVEGKLITAEVSPHHLMFCTDDYKERGARIKMNPSVKSERDRQALRQGVLSGRIDIVATDHAPHLLTEKEGGALKAVSGAPMVQFSTAVTAGLFGPETVSQVMSSKVREVFAIRERGCIAPGYKADMMLMEQVPEGYTVTDADVLSKCGWTPLAGVRLYWRVKQTFITGPEPLLFR
ncbi:MAG: amidohydrolase family protein [Muribaculaceae bacterium]|nr:amidohydrolase family protein [Muribaculaceae bacterium]